MVLCFFFIGKVGISYFSYILKYFMTCFLKCATLIHLRNYLIVKKRISFYFGKYCFSCSRINA